MYDLKIRSDKRQHSKDRTARTDWARELLQIMHERTNTLRDRASERGIAFEEGGFDAEWEELDEKQKELEEKLGSSTTMRSFVSAIWDKDKKNLDEHIEKVKRFWDRTQRSWTGLNNRIRQANPSSSLQSTTSLPATAGEAASRGSGAQTVRPPSPQPDSQRSQSAPLLADRTQSDASSASATEPRPAQASSSYSLQGLDADSPLVPSPSGPKAGANRATPALVPTSTAGPRRTGNATLVFENSHDVGSTYQVGGNNNTGSTRQVYYHNGRSTTTTQPPSPSTNMGTSEAFVEPVSNASTPGPRNNTTTARNNGQWGRTVYGDGNVTDNGRFNDIQGNGNVVGGNWGMWMANSRTEGNTVQIGGNGNIGSTWQETVY